MNALTDYSLDTMADVYPQQRLIEPVGMVGRIVGTSVRWLKNACEAVAPIASYRCYHLDVQSLASHLDRLSGLDDTTLQSETFRLMRHLRALPDGRTGNELALAIASTVAVRVLKVNPFAVQHLAAWRLLHGNMVEMATGEGKTLAIGLAAAAAAIRGENVHVLTANNYLVNRDQLALTPLFNALNLSCAAVLPEMNAEQRWQAWRCKVVYATASELVFDYLRDHINLAGDRDHRRQIARQVGHPSNANSGPTVPGLHFCIVDEADSILLDEAVTPLILSRPGPPPDIPGYQQASAFAQTLTIDRDYKLSWPRVQLTERGYQSMLSKIVATDGVLWPSRRARELVEAALCAQHNYLRDREYAVVADRIRLIDPLTGRIANGRQWQGPLQTMIELKEGIAPQPPSLPVAQLTYQRFFPRYLRLSGISGTLREATREMRRVYRVPVSRVPLGNRNHRVVHPSLCYVNRAAQWRAVLADILDKRAAGRPVLVGTNSVSDSEQLAQLLRDNGITCQLLNATQDAMESVKIYAAGRSACVTVSTNMAGRGTDIQLDDKARRAGGLHVIATACNRSARIDRQLLGRAARSGDPGSVQSIYSLDDPLMRRLLPTAIAASIALTAGPEGLIPGLCAIPLRKLVQQITNLQDRSIRRELRLADAQAHQQFAFSGGIE